MKALPIVIVLAAAIVTSCTRAVADETSDAGRAGASAEEIFFQIDPEKLGPPVEAPGVTVRPPVEWQALTPSQRDALAAGVTERQESSELQLHVIDLYLHTDNLSYLALSAVQRDGEPLHDIEAYASRLTMQVEALDDETAIASSFLLSGREVRQFQFVEDERASFILLLPTTPGVLQLEYSIHLSSIESEIQKLESSIGSIQWN